MKHRVRNRGKGKRAEHELPLLPFGRAAATRALPLRAPRAKLAGWSAAPPWRRARRARVLLCREAIATAPPARVIAPGGGCCTNPGRARWIRS